MSCIMQLDTNLQHNKTKTKKLLQKRIFLKLHFPDARPFPNWIIWGIMRLNDWVQFDKWAYDFLRKVGKIH